MALFLELTSPTFDHTLEDEKQKESLALSGGFGYSTADKTRTA